MAESEEILICNSENCSEKVKHICDCEYPYIYLCGSHIHNEENHESIPIYKAFSEDDKIKIIEMCETCKNECIELKSKLLKECQEQVGKIMKAASELSSNIRQVEILYDDIIAFVSRNKKVRHIGEISLIEKIVASVIGSRKKYSPYRNVPNIKLGMDLTINANQVNLIKYYEDLIQHSVLSFFKPSEKVVVNVLIENHYEIDTKYCESCPEKFGKFCSFCYLPDGRLFSNGGYNGTPTKSTFIFNTQTNRLTKKADSNHPRFSSGNACYYENFVYVFSGKNALDVVTKRVERYDLRNNTWANFESFPEPICDNSSVAFEDGIFITGSCNKNIFKLNVLNNTYAEIYEASSANKFMIKANEKVYLFDSNKLFEYSNNNWDLINSATSVSGKYMYSCPLQNGGYTYFILNDMFLYRFSFITKRLDRIKKIEV